MVDVHWLWTESIVEQTELDRFWDWMSPDERDRHDRFVFEKDRLTFRVSRGLLRHTLSLYGDLAPQEWAFDLGPYGRPEVRQNTEGPVRFNLSHTDGLIAVAVCLGDDLGVDVESMVRERDTLAMADRFFSPAESSRLRELPTDEQDARFYELWTLKESYIKARGMGLALPLSGFSFSVDAPTPTIAFDDSIDDNPGAWTFRVQGFGDDHRLAIAVRRRPTEVTDLRLIGYPGRSSRRAHDHRQV